MDSPGTDFDSLLTDGAAAALALAAAWVVVVLISVALEAASQGRVRFAARLGCPPAVRLWLLGLFMALFAGVAPAQASDAGSGPGAPGTAVATALDGLPLPDRVTGRGIVVRPGDSLWRIARDRLPADADDAHIAAAVAALYAANRPTIGADADRLEPGQHLVFPDPTTLPEAS